MAKLKVRHLPVTRNGKVVGIVSDRDLKLVMGFEEIDTAETTVADVCHPKPYLVGPDALLREVAAEMAEKRLGSAIVVQNGKMGRHLHDRGRVQGAGRDSSDEVSRAIKTAAGGRGGMCGSCR